MPALFCPLKQYSRGLLSVECHSSKENLVAEHLAIESYREMVTYIGNQDPTTRRILEEILASEEEHADDLVSLLDGLKD